MCEHLDKAKGALEAARLVQEEMDDNVGTDRYKRLREQRTHLLDVAAVQASVAQAAALTELVDIERRRERIERTSSLGGGGWSNHLGLQPGPAVAP